MPSNKKNKNSKNKTSGQIIKVPSRPLDLTPRPWYAVTVRISTLAVAILSFNDLFDHMRSQLGLGTSNNLRVRLQHVKVWGPVVVTSSNTVTGQLHIRITNPVTNSVTQEVIRYPDMVTRASVGYVFPDVVQQTSVGTGANPLLTFLAPVAAADVSACVIYVHLLWRFIS